MKFIADRTLGKLVKWLRILGYDTVYWRSSDFEGLLSGARGEGRILITKDTKLYNRRRGLEALLVREDKPYLQLREVVHYFQLPIKQERLFSRCLACNIPLVDVDAEEVRDEVPEYIFYTHQEFSRCPSCRKVYWAGTHYEHMIGLVERLKEGKG